MYVINDNNKKITIEAYKKELKAKIKECKERLKAINKIIIE